MRACDGSCCVAFVFTPAHNGTFASLSPRAQLWVNPGIEDGLDIFAMLEPISYEEACERWDRLAAHARPGGPAGQYFRCVHWDEGTRLCTNYENRPDMCRSYPYSDLYERGCEYGCDCDCDRAPRVWQGDYA